ncbi:MAG: hypothetical protein WCS89_04085 [Candidatus Paceibacterota bacterium]
MKNVIKINQIEPSPKLAFSIMEKITKYETRHFRIRVALHSILTIGTSLAFIPTISYFGEGLSQSGFSSYMSLIISDSSYVMSHFGNLVLSVATSWPVLASIIVLGLTIILINSIRRIVQYSSALSFNHNPSLS